MIESTVLHWSINIKTLLSLIAQPTKARSFLFVSFDRYKTFIHSFCVWLNVIFELRNGLGSESGDDVFMASAHMGKTWTSTLEQQNKCSIKNWIMCGPRKSSKHQYFVRNMDVERKAIKSINMSIELWTVSSGTTPILQPQLN